MKLVFFELNGVKTVRQLAVATGLGEFETSFSLSKLLDMGLVRIVEMNGAGEKPLEISYLPLIGSVLSTFLLVSMFAWVAFSWESDLWTGDPAVVERVSTPSWERYLEGGLSHGLMRRAVDQSMFPTELEVLVIEGWAPGDSLRLEEYDREWEYRVSRLSDRFTLRARDLSKAEDEPGTKTESEEEQMNEQGGHVE